MKANQVVLIIFTILSLNKTFAYTPEEGNVSAILGLTTYKTNFEGSSSGATAPYLGGVSLVAVGDVNDHGSLELGMFYMDKLYFRDENAKYIAEKTQVMHITLGYRYWISSLFSTSLSFFSAYSMGDPETTHSDFIKGSEIDTSARDKTEYGFDFALQGEFWSKDRITLVWDARYSRSVTAKVNEHSDHYGFLLGVRYFIQEKQHRPKKSQ